MSLVTEILHDTIVVTDTDDGVWWPNPETTEEIEAAADPHAHAIEICANEPLRGTWKA